jgi:hypothetical protein
MVRYQKERDEIGYNEKEKRETEIYIMDGCDNR